MTEGQSNTDRAVKTMRRAALSHAGVHEGIACKGTAIESATYKFGGRPFLFLRAGRVMVRLDKSQQKATKLAGDKPECYKIGAGGWTTVTFNDPTDVSIPLLEKWISESYDVVASARASKKTKHK